MREGFALHGAHAVAAGHAAVRLADDPGDDGPARGAGPVPHQGPARRRPERPRLGAGGVRHRRRGRLADDGVVPDAAPLPDADEPDVRAWAACPLLAMGFATAVWQLVVSAFVSGALFSAPMVIWGTLLQRRVPPHMLGRVASLDFFVSVSLMPVSMALAGPVSEAIGLRADVRDRRHRAGGLRGRRDRLGQAARGRDRAPAARHRRRTGAGRGRPGLTDSSALASGRIQVRPQTNRAVRAAGPAPAPRRR